MVNDDIQNTVILYLVTWSRIQVNLSNLPAAPSLQHQIPNYDPNDQGMVRKTYLQKGSC